MVKEMDEMQSCAANSICIQEHSHVGITAFAVHPQRGPPPFPLCWGLWVLFAAVRSPNFHHGPDRTM